MHINKQKETEKGFQIISVVIFSTVITQTTDESENQIKSTQLLMVCGRGKRKYPKKNPQQSREPTNATHKWFPVQI